MSTKRELAKLKGRISGRQAASTVLPTLNPSVFKTPEVTEELLLRFADQLQASAAMVIETGGMMIRNDGTGGFEIWLNPGLVAQWMKENSR